MLRIALSLCTLTVVTAASRADDAAATFKDRVLPVLTANCVRCHGGDAPKAKLNLSGERTLDRLRKDSALWFRVMERVEEGSMPPATATPLGPADKQVIAAWVRAELTDSLSDQVRKEGRSKFRRLSRNEYANTVQDLFGIRPPVVRLLPSEGRIDGYDKLSAALPFSSAGTAGTLKITEDLLSRLLNPPSPKQQGRTYRLWAFRSEQSNGHILELPDDWKVSFNTDTTSGPLRKERSGFPGPRVPGVHRLRLSVYAYQTDKPLAFGIYVGHVFAYPQVLDLDKVLEAPPGKPVVLETEVYLRTGRDSDLPTDDGIRLIPFGLGVQVPKNTLASNCKGPGLAAVQWVDVEEPEMPLPGDRWLCADMTPAFRDNFLRPGATLKNAKLPTDDITTVLRNTFRRVGARLYRRDLTEAELAAALDRFRKDIEGGVPLSTAFRDELANLMTAPDFLAVVEQPGPLTDFALASRLAYFLWNSTPDDELLEVARTKRLTDPKVLRAQTERLLNDPRAQRFVNDFVDQWLGLWGIDNTTPDRDLYPEYDDLLKISSVMETRASFQRMLSKNLSVREFVAPQWALVNGPLAKLYGLSGVSGIEFQEVRLPADSPFGGIWTQAATMKVTANGTLTSPVKRGVWVAERLLGIPIPPPPANIEPVEPDTRGAKTLREQLALHAGKGSCRACHARFDSFGFALESFDVMGNFRTKHRVADPDFAKLPPARRPNQARWREGLPVDCSGVTPDGKVFADVRELRQMLASKPEQLARGVTRHLITYATSEPATQLDQRTIDAIAKGASGDDYGLRSLVHGVVQSELFRSK